MARRITGHLWADNVFAMREQCIREMNLLRAEHPGDLGLDTFAPDPVRRRYAALDDVQSWCGTWLEWDPRDSGDRTGTERRRLREDWPAIRSEFRSLASPPSTGGEPS